MAVPTVARRENTKRSVLMVSATPNPVTASTSASAPSCKPCRSYRLKLSKKRRRASASSTSCTRLDFPNLTIRSPRSASLWESPR